MRQQELCGVAQVGTELSAEESWSGLRRRVEVLVTLDLRQHLLHRHAELSGDVQGGLVGLAGEQSDGPILCRGPDREEARILRDEIGTGAAQS